MNWLSTKGLPQTSLRKQAIDQGAHILAGAAIALLAMLAVPMWAAVLVAVAAGYAREVWQNDWSPHIGFWSALDLWFYMTGATWAWAAIHLMN